MTKTVPFVVGSLVNLFDVTGGTLDINLKYIPDWWGNSNTFMVKAVWPKFLVLVDRNSNRVNKIPISRITDITGNDITIQ